MYFTLAVLDLRSVAKLSNGAFIDCSVLTVKRDTESALYNSSLINIFSATFIGPKTLQNDEDRHQTV